MIPTSWLLSIFLNPDIYHETDLWTKVITDRVIDRLIVEGNSSFIVFFVIAMLQWKQSTLLTETSLEGLMESIQMMPWSLDDTDITQVLHMAETIEDLTPVSVQYALIGVISQCSPGLLSPSVTASGDVLYSRLIDFYKWSLTV